MSFKALTKLFELLFASAISSKILCLDFSKLNAPPDGRETLLLLRGRVSVCWGRAAAEDTDLRRSFLTGDGDRCA